MDELYQNINELRNRLSNDGDGFIYEEDYLLLDRVLDLLEQIEQIEEVIDAYDFINNNI